MSPNPLHPLFCLLCITMVGADELVPDFYSKTCPKAESIVRDVMNKALIREPRSVASIMRLQFHDCFVNGCDGSVLLDDTPDMLGEKLALSNINSLRSFEVVDEVKDALEVECPGIVSCADIIIMASRDAVALMTDRSMTFGHFTLNSFPKDCNLSFRSLYKNLDENQQCLLDNLWNTRGDGKKLKTYRGFHHAHRA